MFKSCSQRNSQTLSSKVHITTALFNYVILCCHTDHFAGVELDALHTSIDTLTARLRRYPNSSKNNNLVNNQQQKMYRRNTYVQGSQISQLKSSLKKLSLLNAENTKKVKLVESTIKSKERNRC